MHYTIQMKTKQTETNPKSDECNINQPQIRPMKQKLTRIQIVQFKRHVCRFIEMPLRGRGANKRGGRGRARGASTRRGSKTSKFVAGKKRRYSTDECEVATTSSSKPLDLDTDLKTFFRGNTTFDDHYNAQECNKDKYVAGLLVLGEIGVEVSQNARVRALAAAWARHDHTLACSLLMDRDKFGLAEVAKALSLLDSARLVRIHEKKIRHLEKSKSKVSPSKLGKLKSDIDNLNATKPSKGSVSGALCRHIKQWVQQFTQRELEFFALYFPKEPWTKMADICHLNPTKDFPHLSWFLPFCFGAPAPEGTMVHRCSTITQENVDSLVSELEIPYAYLNKHKFKLSDASKARIANYTSAVDTILWYYEDLKSADVDAIITKRLRRGDPINLSVGKLLERLLMLHKMKVIKGPKWLADGDLPVSDTVDQKRAPFFDLLIELSEPKLSSIQLDLPSPIVIIGDRSASMQVAINTSVIIAGILTALTSAKLVFFNDKNWDAPFLPTNIEQVLQLSSKITAECCTAPAASLWPFYKKQEIVKTFIIVTDEEENTCFENTMFGPLFEQYHKEVYPARLVFVSFLRQHTKGDMISRLQQFNPMQFVFDPNKPDLTKLDTLFGLLSSECQDFDQKIVQKTQELRELGLKRIFEDLKIDKIDSALCK